MAVLTSSMKKRATKKETARLRAAAIRNAISVLRKALKSQALTKSLASLALLEHLA
jgi:hypothetical protein